MLAAAEFSKQLLLFRGIAEAVDDLPSCDQKSVAAEGYAALIESGRDHYGCVKSVLGYPSVGLWGHATLDALRSGDPRKGRPERLAVLALAAARRARTELTLATLTERDTLAVPSYGVYDVPGAADRTPYVLRARDGALTFTGGLVPGRRHIRNLALGEGAWEVRFDDTDATGFPFQPGQRATVQPRDFGTWQSRLREGADLLSAHHPAAAAEVFAAIKVLTPVKSRVGGHASASCRAAFGCVALSLPQDGTQAAETFVHETQHLKLNALMTMFTLVRPGAHGLFYAPWRPDPRPFLSLFHGAYAHLGIALFWRHEWQRTGSLIAAARFARWREVTFVVTQQLLAAGGCTPLGRTFAEGMLRTLEGLREDKTPATARTWALGKARLHHSAWRKANG
ncbi:HEXXH motif-containing protein [Nonomuraea thailandensis]|uniref:HEXXH motif-containing protein n=1 Tax=Nonomuraea thailandensis TaxID=1188745 RepID=A0A9X2GG10_9ACTN|nr:HEXXH motif-containing putative peptide modification protein [Nonomuraea thailandensis]MCP2356997.1 HEXXH motif-containing protein [Nonomuraea thailandensis]